MENKIFYVCKYTPIELIKSYDLEMVKFDPKLGASNNCKSMCHPNLCGYGRAVLEEIFEKDIKSVFLVDCCDVCRRIYDILAKKKKMDFLFLMYLPHKKGAAEIGQMKRELLRLNNYLEEYTKREFDENKARKIWQSEVYEFENSKIDEKRIILTGAHGSLNLKDKIEKITGLPVEDDTCTGNREILKQDGSDFMTDYAFSLLQQKSPCMRMQFEREDDPKSIGTVFHTMKFCDYYGFKYKSKSNDKSQILKIETDASSESEGQIRTRLEAFSELINPFSLKTKKSSDDKKYVCGIDSGSSSTNAVILDKNKKIVGFSIISTGKGSKRSGEDALKEALKNAGLKREDISDVITTGYGRDNLDISNSSVTEISCHAKGARYLYKGARTVIDIGGQDSKVISLDDSGDIINFVMNDKCAAGTGRFLEMMAKTLGLSLQEMSRLGLEWKKPVTISNTCTVFAESEVVSLIADNTEVSDIINGLNQSIASKTTSLVKRSKGKSPYIMTGGVSNNLGVVKALEDNLKEKIYVPKEAQICGALGAALFAFE